MNPDDIDTTDDGIGLQSTVITTGFIMLIIDIIVLLLLTIRPW